MHNWSWIRKIEWMSVDNIKSHIISNCEWYQTAKLCSDSWEITCFIQYMNIKWIWEIMCFMLFVLTCSAVFWAADYLRLPGILSYPQQAVCEDRQCSPGHCSGKSHILAWAWQHCQEDLLCIIHWTSVCNQFTWSDIQLSAYHTHNNEDDDQKASQCRMTFIHHLYYDLLSQTADDFCTVSCRNLSLTEQIWDWWLTLLSESSYLLIVSAYMLVMKSVVL